jgi:hypothetical protein
LYSRSRYNARAGCAKRSSSTLVSISPQQALTIRFE